MALKFLTALPVHNEESHVADVLGRVRQFSPHILVVNDGSRDGTASELAKFPDVHVETHKVNQGYGAALRTAFDFVLRSDFDALVTIDCDGQHEPQRIPEFVAACADVDIVSGSRYLRDFAGDDAAPEDRRRINMQVTAELNRRLGYQLTDAFCGFKAYQTSALRKLKLTEAGYAMPLELWVRAAAAGLKVKELPVPRIYLEEQRSFGGALDDAATRVQYYHLVLDRSMAALEDAHDCAGVLCSGARD